MFERIIELFSLHHDRLECIERTQAQILATLAELNAAIAAAPGEITNSVVTVVKPIIEAARLPVDFTDQIAAISAIRGKVSDSVKAELEGAISSSVTNPDGSKTTTTQNPAGPPTVTTTDAAGNVIPNP